MKNYSLQELAQLIDHTNLKPTATKQDMKQLCREAAEYQFKTVAVNQVQSQLCREELKDTDVHVGAAISFPLGQTTIEAKLFETENAIKSGATEIDYVINLTEVKNGNWDYIEQEMAQIVQVCRKHHVISKVIFENAYLTNDEKISLCHIAKKVGPDFIKTSTGFGPSGATVEDVTLMKRHVGDDVKVKAAGGIRDADTFLKMIASGAERIGTSSGIAIITELEKRLNENGTDYFTI